MKIVTALLLLATTTLASAALPPPEHVHWVILAGGSGTRLWPLSRATKPKQFLELTEGNLIQQSIDRLKLYPSFEQTHVYLSTGSDVIHQIDRLRAEGLKVDDVFVEPSRRDTGPAILLAALKILEKDPNAHIMFLPADPYIPEQDYPVFAQYLIQSMEASLSERLVLLGKKPTYATTAYGYIESGANLSQGAAFAIQRFHEKPKLEVAETYLKSPNMLWNMGIFAAKGQTFARIFAKHAPIMYQDLQNYLHGQGNYDACEKKSVDFAVMEPASLAGELAVIAAQNFSWYDVGNIDVFITLRQSYLAEQQLNSLTYQYQAQNNKAMTKDPNKLVAFVGVEGLCVIDETDVLLVAKCSDAENLKKVVDELKLRKDFERFL